MTALVRWTPWEELADFEREAGRMFRSLLEPLERLAPVPIARSLQWVPACDMVTRGEDLVVRFELPGIDPEKDIQLTVEDGMLCVRGERRFQDDEKAEGYYRRGVARGSFERAVRLPEGLKPEDIKATYDSGILEVVLPKAAALPQANRIPIQVGGQKKALKAKGPSRAA